jgi:succinyl-diaminopimelate desuccinylase
VERRRLRALVDRSADRIVAFARRLVETPSLSGEEGALAALVADEMRALRYDDVQVDELGNVIGRIAGGGGPTTMLHAHMDIVAPGDESRWHHAPYGGEVADGYLWGRGASDTKGSLAAQVYAAGLLCEAGLAPPGDVYQAAVVCEETGGLGTRHLVTHLLPDVAIIGEPSGNTLRRGHRGRFEFVVTLHGVPAHASAPARGINPHYSMARFLLALREAPLVRDPVFGGSSVAPTLAYVDGPNSNVIPGRLTVHLDWRASPADSEAQARALLDRLLTATLEDGVRPEVAVRTRRLRTYTGVEREVQFVLTGYVLSEDDPLLVAAHESLVQALGRPVEVGVWTFCTDGGHLAAAGVPCIGFGPGAEDQAHVHDERLSIDELLEATVAYMALALRRCEGRAR